VRRIVTIRVAVAGAGYWGINHVRVFTGAAGAELVAIADPDPAARARAAELAPRAKLTSSFDALLGADIDAVVIATPAPSHAELARRALRAGKHVLVEKPLALSMADAEQVVREAAARERVLLVGHLMLYHPVVERLGALLRSGELGELYYLHARRVNLGRLRREESALWSFGPHDLSMIDALLGELPVSVTARGESYLQPGVPDVVFVTLKYARGTMAHIHLSWLDPRKERRLTLVCSKKMVEFDDVASEKLRIYDKGYEKPPAFTRFEQYLTLRNGDIHLPHVPMREPLAAEAADFLAKIRRGDTSPDAAHAALRVIRVLEAAQRSLDRDGAPVALDGAPKT
jgi:predicted dehydrogenase